MQALLVAELLAADVGLAVVAEEDDDRAVGQAVGFELIQDQADLAVQLGGRVEVGRAIVAGDGVVGLVGRDLDLGRVGPLRSLEWPVRLLEVDLGEERLMGLQVGPSIRVERLAGGVKFQSVLAVPRKPSAGGKVPDVGRVVAARRGTIR